MPLDTTKMSPVSVIMALLLSTGSISVLAISGDVCIEESLFKMLSNAHLNVIVAGQL